MTCSVGGCSRRVAARGMCRMHYERWRLNGDPTFSARGTGRRFPLQALARKCGGVEQMARQLGFDGYKDMQRHSNLNRMLVDGVDTWRADVWAVACGWLPHEVWPGWLLRRDEEIA